MCLLISVKYKPTNNRHDPYSYNSPEYIKDKRAVFYSEFVREDINYYAANNIPSPIIIEFLKLFLSAFSSSTF